MSLLSMDNEVFAGFAFYGTLCLVKTATMSLITSWNRFKYGSFNNPQDAQIEAKSDDPGEYKKLMVPKEEVEKVRRAHLNDLENIIPFILLGLLYVATDPPKSTAMWHFQTFFGARLSHTVACLTGMRQSVRSVNFLVGICCFTSMAIRTFIATL